MQHKLASAPDDGGVIGRCKGEDFSIAVLHSVGGFEVIYELHDRQGGP